MLKVNFLITIVKEYFEQKKSLGVSFFKSENLYDYFSNLGSVDVFFTKILQIKSFANNLINLAAFLIYSQFYLLSIKSNIFCLSMFLNIY